MGLYELIGDMPMFKFFSEQEKRDFAAMEHSLLGFNKDDIIIREGDSFTSLYLLIKGTIIITKTAYNTVISKLTPGAVFGEMSFLTKKPRYTNVIANEKVLVMKMDDEFFRMVKPEIKDRIKDYLIELLINRLDAMNESLSKIAKYARSYSLK
ncbi:MAG: cyclic nucleotide-binding domain-containing protein [Deltaproteobacteria bacterium]|nr:MAG: cyclic nucleotide-binding domain-containing protein [Deltaproteobacteria bacterium]